MLTLVCFSFLSVKEISTCKACGDDGAKNHRFRNQQYVEYLQTWRNVIREVELEKQRQILFKKLLFKNHISLIIELFGCENT